MDCAGVDTRAGVTPARARGGRRPALPGPDRTGPEGPGRGWGARGEDKATEGPPPCRSEAGLELPRELLWLSFGRRARAAPARPTPDPAEGRAGAARAGV